MSLDETDCADVGSIFLDAEGTSAPTSLSPRRGMTVSIVTVCLNSAATIRQTIESVLEQDQPGIEYIVIDGGSTDGTLEILESYRQHIAYFVSEPDAGIYDAMNKGIRAATGDVVGILNSDDFYKDASAVSDMVRAMERTGAEAAYADLEIIRPDDPSKVIRYYSSHRFRVSRLRWGWMPPHPTFFVLRSCYERYGLYRTDYRVAADYELLVRFLWRAGITTCRVPRSIIRMRAGGISSSSLRGRYHHNREIVRACRENGVYTNLAMLAFKIPLKLLEHMPAWIAQRTQAPIFQESGT